MFDSKEVPVRQRQYENIDALLLQPVFAQRVSQPRSPDFIIWLMIAARASRNHAESQGACGRGPRGIEPLRAISDRRPSSLHEEEKSAADRVDEAAIVSGANPISVSLETAAAGATSPAPRASTFARARPAMVRTAARRSAPLNVVWRVRGRMRGHRPISKSRRKNPRRMLPARVNQTRLDDVILPVFCPTCQTLMLSEIVVARKRNKKARCGFARAEPNVFR